METQRDIKNRLARERYALTKEHQNERRRELYSLRDNSLRNAQINEYQKTGKGKEVKDTYRKSEKFKKVSMIASWKYNGVIHPDFNELYEKYITTINCESCSILFNKDRSLNCWKCLDHDHSTGLFRKVICNKCNSRDAYLKV